LIILFHPSLVGRGGSQKYIIDYYNYFKKKHNTLLITYNYSSTCYPEIVNENEIIFLNKINKLNHKKIFYPYFLKIIFSFFNELILTYKIKKKIKSILDTNNVKIFFQHEIQFNFLSKLFSSSKKYLYLYDSKNKLYFFDKGKNLNFIDNLTIDLLSIFTKNLHLKNFNNIFVLEEFQKKDVDKRYSINSEVIYGYYNEKKYYMKKNNLIRNRFNLSANTKILFCLSRFSKYKKIEDLLDLMSLINKQSNNHFFLYAKCMKDDLIYEETIISKYKNSFYPSGNSFFDFDTAQSENELFNLYNSSDIFVFPSMNQTWGNAILESIACGQIPLISDDCGINMLVLKNKLGEVYKVGDINDMLNKFNLIVKEPENYKNNHLFTKDNLNFSSHIEKITNILNV